VFEKVTRCPAVSKPTPASRAFAGQFQRKLRVESAQTTTVGWHGSASRALELHDKSLLKFKPLRHPQNKRHHGIICRCSKTSGMPRAPNISYTYIHCTMSVQVVSSACQLLGCLCSENVAYPGTSIYKAIPNCTTNTCFDSSRAIGFVYYEGLTYIIPSGYLT
jgi:hypothetical protein